LYTPRTRGAEKGNFAGIVHRALTGRSKEKTCKVTVEILESHKPAFEPLGSMRWCHGTGFNASNKGIIRCDGLGGGDSSVFGINSVVYLHHIRESGSEVVGWIDDMGGAYYTVDL
jgi:hypothetical protein